MSDNYRTVTCIFRGVTVSHAAIIIDQPPSRGRGTVTIPRSLLHGGDDGKVATLRYGEEFTFRLRDWKAEELGLA